MRSNDSQQAAFDDEISIVLQTLCSYHVLYDVVCELVRRETLAVKQKLVHHSSEQRGALVLDGILRNR